MNSNKVVGIVLIVIGLGIAYWGYQESGALGSQLNEMVSGSPSDNVMVKYLAAAGAVAAGVFLAAKN